MYGENPAGRAGGIEKSGRLHKLQPIFGGDSRPMRDRSALDVTPGRRRADRERSSRLSELRPYFEFDGATD
jgi:hypothetical protein